MIGIYYLKYLHSSTRCLIEMKFRKQNTYLSVKDWSFCQKSKCGGSSDASKHGKLLPNSIRCLICGPSGCGKTNLLLTLLLDVNGLKFENVYLYSKSLQQPKYIFLGEVFNRVPNAGFYTFSDKSEVTSLEETCNNSIIIFDDVSMEDQETIRQYFSMGRHKGLDCFYLCQTYSKIPKQLVRDNANFVILFKQDDLNLKHVYDDHVNTDMSWETFLEMCKTCWKDRYNFIVIDKNIEMDKGRYRRGFDDFICI